MSTPGWHPDPSGRFPQRYWDGGAWTEHVTGPGGAAIDPLPPAPAATDPGAPTRVPSSPPSSQAPTASSAPTTDALLTAPVLTLLRFDHGDVTQLQYVSPDGAVLLDAVEEPKQEGDLEHDSVDELTRKQRTTTMRAVDRSGGVIARLAHVKPWKSDFTVTDGGGRPLLSGEQENVMGAPRFAFSDAGTGAPVAMLRADSAQARSFDVEAPDGTTVARLVKQGSYEVGAMMRQARQESPLVSPGAWLADRAVDAVAGPHRPETVRCVLERPQPVGWPPLALVALLSPMIVELSLSVL